ncbi:hypothetical protein KY334_01825 [Candidatus Woesearchaeota archaeon]|nr:hypothetical protein [Candidatus Woesearchaeota archaeon]
MEINYKVPNGKLLRLDVLMNYERIKDISIRGDFFIYPENKIILLEEALIGAKILEVEEILTKIIKKNEIQVLGFTPKDVVDALTFNNVKN